MTDKTLEEAMQDTLDLLPEVEVKAPPKKKAVRKKVVSKPAPRKASDKVKVKNISQRTLNLRYGQIAAGETGLATLAEVSTLHEYLERIQ